VSTNDNLLCGTKLSIPFMTDAFFVLRRQNISRFVLALELKLNWRDSDKGAEIASSSSAWNLHAVCSGPIGRTQYCEPDLAAIAALVSATRQLNVILHFRKKGE
jgi:hypothetical protein